MPEFSEPSAPEAPETVTFAPEFMAEFAKLQQQVGIADANDAFVEMVAIVLNIHELSRQLGLTRAEMVQELILLYGTARAAAEDGKALCFGEFLGDGTLVEWTDAVLPASLKRSFRAAQARKKFRAANTSQPPPA